MREKFDVQNEAQATPGAKGIGMPAIWALCLAVVADAAAMIIAKESGSSIITFLFICSGVQALFGYSIFHKVDEGARIDRENSPDAESPHDIRLRIIDMALTAPHPSPPSILDNVQFGCWIFVAGIGGCAVGLVWLAVTL